MKCRGGSRISGKGGSYLPRGVCSLKFTQILLKLPMKKKTDLVSKWDSSEPPESPLDPPLQCRIKCF